MSARRGLVTGVRRALARRQVEDALTTRFYGRLVHWHCETHKGAGLVIGHLKKHPDVLMIANARSIGMPINIYWCDFTDETRLEEADRYAKRYNERFPDHYYDIG